MCGSCITKRSRGFQTRSDAYLWPSTCWRLQRAAHGYGMERTESHLHHIWWWWCSDLSYLAHRTLCMFHLCYPWCWLSLAFHQDPIINKTYFINQAHHTVCDKPCVDYLQLILDYNENKIKTWLLLINIRIYGWCK